MRPPLALPLAALLVAGVLAGCTGGGRAPAALPEPSASPSPSLALDDCARPYLTTVSAGQLTVGAAESDAPPLLSIENRTTRVGLEADVVYAIADRLGFRPASVIWRDVTADPETMAVPEDVDFVIGQLRESDDAAVDFSEPYLQVPQAVVVRRDSGLADTLSRAALASARVGVVGARGSSSVNTEARAVTSTEGAAALAARRLDAVVVDLVTASRLAARSDGRLEVAGVLPESSAEPALALAFAPGNPLALCVDGALAGLAADGVLADAAERAFGTQALRSIEE